MDATCTSEHSSRLKPSKSSPHTRSCKEPATPTADFISVPAVPLPSAEVPQHVHPFFRAHELRRLRRQLQDEASCLSTCRTAGCCARPAAGKHTALYRNHWFVDRSAQGECMEGRWLAMECKWGCTIGRRRSVGNRTARRTRRGVRRAPARWVVERRGMHCQKGLRM